MRCPHPCHHRIYPGLLNTVAAAHIVMGYRQRQPTYIKMAVAVLKHLAQRQQQPSSGRSSASALSSSRGAAVSAPAKGSSAVLLMQGMCQLLLGEVQAATKLIKQAEAARCGHACVKMPGACIRTLPSTLLLGITSFQSPHLYILTPVRSTGSETDDLFGSGAYAYVVQHSPAGDDGLLPGLCMLAERWLKKVGHAFSRR